MPKKSSSIRTFQRSMRYRRDLLVDVPRNHKSSDATRLKVCEIRRRKKLVSILPRGDMEDIERKKGGKMGEKLEGSKGLTLMQGKRFRAGQQSCVEKATRCFAEVAEHNATFTFSSNRRGRCTEQERPRTHWTTVPDHSPSTRTPFSLHHDPFMFFD